MSLLERAHSFGEGPGLGIVTLPPGDDGRPTSAAAKGPFVVLLNAGLVHRIGPFRMSVDLARRLASRGFRVLRFDQSGIGDSPARGGAMSVEDQAVTAGKEALTFLAEQYGARSFLVGGLCTGAINAHRLGLADERVQGMWLIDGYAYSTLSSRGRHLAMSLRKPEAWPSIGRRLAQEGTAQIRSILTGEPAPPSSRSAAPSSRRAAQPGGDARTGLFFQSWPPASSVRADLEHMLHRGARFHFVYTGGWSGFTDPDQFDEMFPDLPHRTRITVDFHPDADHTFLTLRDREALFRSVERFVTSSGAPSF